MHTKIITTALLTCILTSGLAFADDQIVTDKGESISHVNSSIHLADGARADVLHSVNGSISIGDHAVITTATTVNGSVRIGEDGHAGRLGTVNGGIGVGKRSVVSGDITSVNGGLELADDALVQGGARTVNGKISLGQRAHIGGQVVTTNGDVTLQDNARVDGGIRVKDYNNWFTDMFGDFFAFHHKPVIIIGPGAQVGGELVFEHKVELRVHATAKIGSVTGATVQPY